MYAASSDSTEPFSDAKELAFQNKYQFEARQKMEYIPRIAQKFPLPSTAPQVIRYWRADDRALGLVDWRTVLRVVPDEAPPPKHPAHCPQAECVGHAAPCPVGDERPYHEGEQNTCQPTGHEDDALNSDAPLRRKPPRYDTGSIRLRSRFPSAEIARAKMSFQDPRATPASEMKPACQMSIRVKISVGPNRSPSQLHGTWKMPYAAKKGAQDHTPSSIREAQVALHAGLPAVASDAVRIADDGR